MTAAALALHYQNDVLHSNGKIALGLAQQQDKRAQLIAGAGQFLSAARAAGILVVHVHICFAPDGSDILQNNDMFRAVYASGAMRQGSWGAAAFEGFEPMEGEPVITHHRVNAFYGSQLEKALDARGVNQLYLGGIATNSVVEHTARHAADMGYEVTAIEEACATARDDLHVAALENIRLIGRVMGVEAFVQALK
jgi:nicotinamidase-related amidase